MRDLRDFLDARRVKCRYRTLGELCARCGFSEATYHRIADSADTTAQRSRARTLEALAEALRFREWAELLEAWRADDVTRGMEAPADDRGVKYDEAWNGVFSAAQKRGLSPDYVRQLIEKTRPKPDHSQGT